jgi:hypothetical protein
MEIKKPKSDKREKDNILVRNVLEYIKGAEKQYGIVITKRGCASYIKQRTAEARLKSEIAQREAELEQLKAKAK